VFHDLVEATRMVAGATTSEADIGLGLLGFPAVMPLPARATPSSSARKARLERLFADNFRMVWRLVRRLGLPEGSADDAGQQVFLIAAERLDDIVPGRERAFVFGTALRVVRTLQRKLGRESPTDHDLQSSPVPLPDVLADQKRARELIDAVLERMPADLKTTFILFELEGLRTREISNLVGIPQGTVASRLRRARQQFRQFVQQYMEGARQRGETS
jgi:RNA polymerase sigma-70 factor (ECF subfamily)